MATPMYRCVVPSCDRSQTRGDKITRANVVDPTALNAITGRSMAPNSKAALCEQHYAEHVTSRRLDRGGSGSAVAVVALGKGEDRLAEIHSNERTELSEFSASELRAIVRQAESRRGFHDVDTLYDAIIDAVIARLGEARTRKGEPLTADERKIIIDKAAHSARPGKKDMLAANDESGERRQRAHVHLDASVGDDDSLISLGYFLADEPESLAFQVSGVPAGEIHEHVAAVLRDPSATDEQKRAARAFLAA